MRFVPIRGDQRLHRVTAFRDHVAQMIRLAASLAIWLMGFAWSSGCYQPVFSSCRVPCSAPHECPGGLTCVSGLCASEGAVCPNAGAGDASPDGNPGTGGGAMGDACVTTEPLCEAPPAGQICNPVCQTGCPCNQRCNLSVSTLQARCVPLGSKQLAELCTVGSSQGSDDCAPGLICLAESATCGPNVHRCYRLCASDDQCKPVDDVRCRIAIINGTLDTGFRACDVPVQVCDPVDKVGCPSGLTCFLQVNGKTLCDCPSNLAQVPPNGQPGPGKEGAPCVIYSDCGAGLTCVLSGSATTCRPICKPGKTTCADGTTCAPVGTTFGVCPGK